LGQIEQLRLHKLESSFFHTPAPSHSANPQVIPIRPQIPQITAKFFESNGKHLSRHIIFRIINYAPDVLHEGNEEDHEDRVSEEGRPRLREDLLCPHDSHLWPLRAL